MERRYNMTQEKNKPKKDFKPITIRIGCDNHKFLKQLSYDTCASINSIINTLIYDKRREQNRK
jgi:hypothetical protein